MSGCASLSFGSFGHEAIQNSQDVPKLDLANVPLSPGCNEGALEQAFRLFHRVCPVVSLAMERHEGCDYVGKTMGAALRALRGLRIAPLDHHRQSLTRLFPRLGEREHG